MFPCGSHERFDMGSGSHGGGRKSHRRGGEGPERRHGAGTGTQYKEGSQMRQELRVLFRRPAAGRETRGRDRERHTERRHRRLRQAFRMQLAGIRQVRLGQHTGREDHEGDISQGLRDRRKGGVSPHADDVLSQSQRSARQQQRIPSGAGAQERMGLRRYGRHRLGRNGRPRGRHQGGKRPDHAGRQRLHAQGRGPRRKGRQAPGGGSGQMRGTHPRADERRSGGPHREVHR